MRRPPEGQNLTARVIIQSHIFGVIVRVPAERGLKIIGAVIIHGAARDTRRDDFRGCAMVYAQSGRQNVPESRPCGAALRLLCDSLGEVVSIMHIAVDPDAFSRAETHIFS